MHEILTSITRVSGIMKEIAVETFRLGDAPPQTPAEPQPSVMRNDAEESLSEAA